MTTAISSPTDDTRYKDMRSRSPVTQSSRQLSSLAFDAKSANRYLQPTVLSPPTTAHPPPATCALQPKSHLQSRHLEPSAASERTTTVTGQKLHTEAPPLKKQKKTTNDRTTHKNTDTKYK